MTTDRIIISIPIISSMPIGSLKYRTPTNVANTTSVTDITDTVSAPRYLTAHAEM